MSTQLLDPPKADDVTDEFASAIAAPVEGVSFDRATRQRLLVAEQVADTLESLSDSRAWDRLDPAIQRHLLAQSGALRDHVEHLGSQRIVRSVEDAALRLKRLERRLEIAVDHLAPPKDAKRGAAGLFLGDFTEAEIEEVEGAPKKKAVKKESAKAKAVAAIGQGVQRFKSKAERAAAKASSRRIHWYIGIGVATCVAALGWNFKETLSDMRHVSKPPSHAVEMNRWLSDLHVFLPVTSTIAQDRGMRLVVSKEWLLRSEAERKTDAEGAHVWLANRNVPTVMIAWEDGTPVAFFHEDKVTWFEAKPTR